MGPLNSLNRRRPEWSSRHSRSPLGSPSVDFGNFDAIGLGGDPGVGAAVGVVLEEEDEGKMAEDASLMFITALRWALIMMLLVTDPIIYQSVGPGAVRCACHKLVLIFYRSFYPYRT